MHSDERREDVGPDPATLDLAQVYRELGALNHRIAQLQPDVEPISQLWEDSDDDEPKDLRMRRLGINLPKENIEADSQDKTSIELKTLNERSILLRARARVLSEHGVRPLRLLDLPHDVLHQICNYMGRFGRHGHRQPNYELCKGPKRRRQDVRNMRLVCRTLHDLASPILFEFLRLSLDEGSLLLAQRIAERPYFANGVRVLRLDMRYYPAPMAHNLASFIAEKSGQMHMFDREADYHNRTWYLNGRNTPIPAIFGFPQKVYIEAMANYKAMNIEWQDLMKSARPIEVSNENTAYQNLLVESFLSFRKSYEEQARLLRSGAYLSGLASAMKRMPVLRTLRFDDDRAEESFNRIQVLVKNDVLSWYLKQPLIWKDAEQWNEEDLHFPASLILDLSTQACRAGVRLDQLYVNVFPTRGGFEALESSTKTLVNSSEPVVQQEHPCKNTTTFEFTGGAPLRSGSNTRDGTFWVHFPVSKQGQTQINTWFRNILSGANLRELSIHCHDLKVWEMKVGQIGQANIYPLGGVLSRTALPHIQKLKISHVAFKQRELEEFIRGTGPNVSVILLGDLLLDGGIWAPTLRMLRDKFAARIQKGLCEIHFSYWEGGEFNQGRQKQKQKHQLLKLAEKYVKGDDDTGSPWVSGFSGRVELPKKSSDQSSSESESETSDDYTESESEEEDEE